MCSLSSRNAGRKQEKDLCIPRRPHLPCRLKSSVNEYHLIELGLVLSPMHRSFVGSPSLCEGLRFLRMTEVKIRTDCYRPLSLIRDAESSHDFGNDLVFRAINVHRDRIVGDMSTTMASDGSSSASN